jgi:hypothetical protein
MTRSVYELNSRTSQGGTFDVGFLAIRRRLALALTRHRHPAPLLRRQGHTSNFRTHTGSRFLTGKRPLNS